MIVLDTNVISELMKESPDKNVVDWISDFDAEQIYTTSITIAELHYGIEALPQGKRKLALRSALSGLSGLFDKRVLSFDAKSALHYADITIRRKRQGRPISVLDSEIAAICSHHQITLATRNTVDFEALEIDVVNPWKKSSIAR